MRSTAKLRGREGISNVVRFGHLRTMGRFHVESVKTQLTLGAIGVTVSVIVLVHVLLSAATENAATEEMYNRADGTTRCFASVVAESVAARDAMQIHLLCRAFEGNDIDAVVLLDANGESLFSSGPDYLSRAALTPAAELKSDGFLLRTEVIDGESLVHVARPIRFSDVNAGTTHVWINSSSLARSIHEAHAAVYPIITIGLLVLTLLVFVTLNAPFRTLKRLTIAADRIGAGDLEERVPERGGDEMAGFCRAFNRMAENVARSRQETIEKHLETVHAMINTVEAKDQYTVGHCLRVGGLVRRMIEREEGLSNEERFRMETAAILHDIGKIGIPDQILLKRGKLTREEEETIRSHVIVGENILGHIDSMKQVAEWVRHHHERWDGAGYPDGLRGDEIPFTSRAITIADAIDAMMTDRPYRRGLDREKVLSVLREESGKQFDPRLVVLAIEILTSGEDDELPIGKRTVPDDETLRDDPSPAVDSVRERMQLA